MWQRGCGNLNSVSCCNVTTSLHQLNFRSLSQPHCIDVLFGHSRNLTTSAYFLVTLPTSLHQFTFWSLLQPHSISLLLVTLATSLHQFTFWSFSQPHCISLLLVTLEISLHPFTLWSPWQPHCISLIFGHSGNLTLQADFLVTYNEVARVPEQLAML